MFRIRVNYVAVSLAALAATAATVAPGLADESDATLSRLALDRRFRGDGATLARLGFDVVDQIRIDSAGRIVVAGAKLTFGEVETGIEVYAPLVARLLPSGRVDPTFGVNGVVQPAALGRIGGFAFGPAYQGGGKILIVGRFIDQSLREVGAARLYSSGAPDGSFGDGGTVATVSGAAGPWRFPALDPTTGAITLVAGEGASSRIVRLTGDGAFDASYGTGGVVSMDGFYVAAMSVDGEGRAIIGRITPTDPRTPQTQHERDVVRLAGDGSLDPAYGGDGNLHGPAGAAVGAGALGFDSAGRLVVRGQEEGERPGWFRFLADGALDASFSGDGFAPETSGVPGDAEGAPQAFSVTAAADGPYVSSGDVQFLSRSLSHPLASGYFVQSVDPANPSALRTLVVRDRRPIRLARTLIRTQAVSPDGSTVVVGGYRILVESGGHERTRPFLVRTDLTRSAPVPLPDIRIEQFSATSRSVDGAFQFDVELDVANDGRGAWRNGSVIFHLSDDDVLDASDLVLGTWSTGPVPRGGTARVRIRTGWYSFGGVAGVSGKRLLAQLNPDEMVLETGGANAVVAAPAFP